MKSISPNPSPRSPYCEASYRAVADKNQSTIVERAAGVGAKLLQCTRGAIVRDARPLASVGNDGLSEVSRVRIETVPCKKGLQKKVANLSFLMVALLPRVAWAGVQSVIKDGVFGAGKGVTLGDATVVSRGDHESRVYLDPANEDSGIILSSMAYEKMSQNCPLPGTQFQLAVEAAYEVHNYWDSLSKQEQVEFITQHVVASSTFSSPLLSLSLNEAIGAYFALGARNASSLVYRGLVSNKNLYASGQPGFEVPAESISSTFEIDQFGLSFNPDYGATAPVERWLNIAGNHSIPLAEFLCVGGFYFRESIDPLIAIKQHPSTFKTPDSLHQTKNISQIQRKLHSHTEPLILDFKEEFEQSVRVHTNQTVQEQGFLDPNTFDYFPDYN